MSVVNQALTSGKCRVCGCTEERACIIQWGPGESLDTVKACWWIDAKKTLCSNPKCLAQIPLEDIEREILMDLGAPSPRPEELGAGKGAVQP
jgi:hypothetical protein